MSLDRAAIPDWPAYADAHGLPLVGRGRWRTTRCDLHGGSDSLRVNVETGGWCCMGCHAKGGDTLAFHIERAGLTFAAAARDLGAWREDGQTHRPTDKPRTLSAREAMEVVAFELLVLVVVIADVRRGILPTDDTWMRFLTGAGRIEALAMEYRT
jgi:hypothetical protein